METRKKRVVVKHVEKELTIDSGKEMCKWMHMAKTL
jgi:hypothetical protein